MRVAIYHNILWSRYKGVVFSHVHSVSRTKGIAASFIQIAETEDMRLALGGVDMSYHEYPFRLLFRGAYTHAPLFRRITALAKDLYRNPCDLVVMPGYNRSEYWAMLLMCILLRRKRVVFCDSTQLDRDDRTWLKETAKRLFFSWCNGVFCYGIRSKEYLMGYGVPASKIVYRCQAAALPKNYDASTVARAYRENWHADGKASRFLYVGRLSEEKGLYDLLSAFKMLLESEPDARLDLIGAGPLTEQLTARVVQMRLEHRVSFLGVKPMEEISAQLMSSTALVLPSHSEPWGLVINESLSYGCPVVVSSACGCVPDLVVEGVTGYSFDVGDVNALLSALHAVGKMSAERPKVARQCLELIAHFTPERAAAQILDGCVGFIENAA